MATLIHTSKTTWTPCASTPQGGQVGERRDRTDLLGSKVTPRLTTGASGWHGEPDGCDLTPENWARMPSDLDQVGWPMDHTALLNEQHGIWERQPRQRKVYPTTPEMRW